MKYTIGITPWEMIGNAGVIWHVTAHFAGVSRLWNHIKNEKNRRKNNEFHKKNSLFDVFSKRNFLFCILSHTTFRVVKKEPFHQQH